MGRADSAFTLIELLIVVAIIAILASVAAANMFEAQMRSKVASALSSQHALSTALEAYCVDYSKYPPAQNAFIDAGAVTETWRLSTPTAYITQVPKDIFHNEQPFGLIGGDFGPGGPYMHYINDPVVTEYWLLWSYGPDRDMEFGHVDYDPTNGTASDGDIYRVGSMR